MPSRMANVSAIKGLRTYSSYISWFHACSNQDVSLGGLSSCCSGQLLAASPTVADDVGACRSAPVRTEDHMNWVPVLLETAGHARLAAAGLARALKTLAVYAPCSRQCFVLCSPVRAEGEPRYARERRDGRDSPTPASPDVPPPSTLKLPPTERREREKRRHGLT